MTHRKRYAGALIAAEAAGVDADGVAPNGDRRGSKRAGAVGNEVALHTGVVVVNHDLGVGNHGAARVGDGPGDSPADHLGQGVLGNGQGQREQA